MIYRHKQKLKKKKKWLVFGQFSISNWKEKGHKPSQANLKILQLELLLDPAWLGLITSNFMMVFVKYLFTFFFCKSLNAPTINAVLFSLPILNVTKWCIGIETYHYKVICSAVWLLELLFLFYQDLSDMWYKKHVHKYGLFDLQKMKNKKYILDRKILNVNPLIGTGFWKKEDISLFERHLEKLNFISFGWRKVHFKSKPHLPCQIKFHFLAFIYFLVYCFNVSLDCWSLFLSIKWGFCLVQTTRWKVELK